ncbi:MAG TPA: hypothetical protein VKP78_06810 [bacterium]|nr:hypothetical protein [bacterium]
MKKILAGLLIISLVFAASENIQVTIYNNNQGLVRTEKSIQLQKGTTQFQIPGVAAQIDPTSVHLKFDQDDKVDILEMNFLYDLVSSSKIFKKYTGKQIEFRLQYNSDYTGSYKGKLLRYSGGNIILEEEDGEIKIVSSSRIIDYKFPELPGGLITKPTLKWQIDSRLDGEHGAELSYLTNGLDWHAEYVLILAENDRDFSLSSWISLNNQSGASYKNAKVKLIAGDLHRAQPEQGPRPVMLARRAEQEQVQRREIFDYHLYELDRRVDLANREIKQIALFENVEAQTEKKYIYENSAYQSSDQSALSVNLFIKNSEENNLGFPLPKGKVRMFKKDVDESLQMIGEDRIDHTGKEEELQLIAGKAFDVKGERKILDRERYNREEIIKAEISLHNRTDKEVQIEVHENHHGDWHIKNSTDKYKKESNALLIFPVSLKANQDKTIQYTFVREF